MTATNSPKTPTEALIKAMETAELMQDVVILYRTSGDSGVGWISSVVGITEKLGIIEEAKCGIFAHRYGLIQE